jgi:hypothetical protein
MMSKAAEVLMYLQTGTRPVILAMFLFDSTYEVYYGFNDVIPPTTQTV